MIQLFTFPLIETINTRVVRHKNNYLRFFLLDWNVFVYKTVLKLLVILVLEIIACASKNFLASLLRKYEKFSVSFISFVFCVWPYLKNDFKYIKFVEFKSH